MQGIQGDFRVKHSVVVKRTLNLLNLWVSRLAFGNK